MSGIVMMIIAIVVLGGAYLLYGRYLQNKWGIDPKAKTPAYEMEDGVDYVPADTNVVFGHQFASIAGAGPINGPIQAAIFGWLPVMLWILIGGVFFGACLLYTSYTTNMVNGNICLQDRFLKLPKMQSVKIKLHRIIPEGWKLKSVTVSREPSGKYFASLSFLRCLVFTVEQQAGKIFSGRFPAHSH